MNQNILFTAIIALIVGFGAGYLTNQTSDTPATDHSMHGSMQEEMSSMMEGLEGKTGDAFDAAFLSEMIVHHEGAVAMAEGALRNAKHEELRRMASAIIDAQTTEIAQMRDWLQSWYGQ